MSYNHEADDICNAIGITEKDYKDSYYYLCEVFNKSRKRSMFVEEIENKVTKNETLRKTIVSLVCETIKDMYREKAKRAIQKSVESSIISLMDLFKEVECNDNCSDCPKREDCEINN